MNILQDAVLGRSESGPGSGATVYRACGREVDGAIEMVIAFRGALDSGQSRFVKVVGPLDKNTF